jgi:hypothetical protein
MNSIHNNIIGDFNYGFLSANGHLASVRYWTEKIKNGTLPKLIFYCMEA